MRVKLSSLFVALVVVLSFPFYAVSAQAINLEGRSLLFKASPQESTENASLKISDEARRAVISFKLPAGVDVEQTLYAMFLAGADKERIPLIFLNQRRVDASPVRRRDGLVFRLPPKGFHSFDNILELRSPDNLPLKFNAIEVFSLIDTFEEVHFERAFAETIILVQPPTHPDQNKYDALHYDLDIKLDMYSTLIDAVLSLTVRVVGDSLNQCVLDFDPNGGLMNISRVDSGEGTPPLSFSTDDANDRLFITLPRILSNGEEFIVRVFYSGYPSTAGTFGAPYRAETHGSSVPVVYTFSEPYGARKWWPCKDIPEDKATMDLHITADNPYFVVSNGKLLSIEEVGGGKRRFNYSETYPMVTYLASICCTNYIFGSTVYTSQDGTTTMTVGHYVYPENADELGGIVGTMEGMQFFSRTFGEYPFLREKYVTATHNSGAAMEHQTATSMPPRDLIPDGRGRRNIHELAHQWFGDSITMRHFDHLWLNEGFATYCEALYVENYQGKQAYHNYVNNWETIGINDTTPLVNSNADAFWGSLVYRKGAWVLHMLRHVVGDEKFFQAMRNYMQSFAYATALTPDLQGEFEAVYGASLNWFFQEWVYGTGRPTYYWSWYTETTESGNTLRLTITQMQSGSAFVMPLDVKVSDANGNSATFIVWNDQKTQSFAIDIGNLEAFNVEIDPENWVLNRVGTAAPMPTLKSIIARPDRQSVTINWESGGGNTAGFQLISSENLGTWTLIADAGVLSGSTQNYIVSALTPGKVYYFRLRALASSGLPSSLSDIYGVRLPLSATSAKVLVVDGYDRWDSQGRGTSHKWAAWHGEAVNSYGVAFDACANEAVIDGSININDYAAVLWVLGEESTANETFSNQEQTLVKSFLEAGGKLFVSGAEIGWDLDYRGTGSDRYFYNNYLKASYVSDDSDDYSVEGTPQGIFSGLFFNFDNGSAGIYPVNYPDVISPTAGSIAALRYNLADVAGVQFSGRFPSGSIDGRLVHLAFPFETIYPAATRNDIMAQILRFFNLQPDSPSGIDDFMLYY